MQRIVAQIVAEMPRPYMAIDALMYACSSVVHIYIRLYGTASDVVYM